MEMKIGAIQMTVTDDKVRNLKTAARAIARLSGLGADLIALPEMFLCPYQADLFHTYAEPSDGPCVQQLSSLAAKHQGALVGCPARRPGYRDRSGAVCRAAG